jgi:hypothetical protein
MLYVEMEKELKRIKGYFNFILIIHGIALIILYIKVFG